MTVYELVADELCAGERTWADLDELLVLVPWYLRPYKRWRIRRAFRKATR